MGYREAADKAMKAIGMLLFMLGCVTAVYLLLWGYAVFICAVFRLPFHICKWPAIFGSVVFIFSMLTTDS